MAAGLTYHAAGCQSNAELLNLHGSSFSTWVLQAGGRLQVCAVFQLCQLLMVPAVQEPRLHVPACIVGLVEMSSAGVVDTVVVT
jgi:hypothetical protein